jgi:hypothetical protein
MFSNQKKISLPTLQFTQIWSSSPGDIPKEKKERNISNVSKLKKIPLSTFQLT